jgi:hypothetical protein
MTQRQAMGLPLSRQLDLAALIKSILIRFWPKDRCDQEVAVVAKEAGGEEVGDLPTSVFRPFDGRFKVRHR